MQKIGTFNLSILVSIDSKQSIESILPEDAINDNIL